MLIASASPKRLRRTSPLPVFSVYVTTSTRGREAIQLEVNLGTLKDRPVTATATSISDLEINYMILPKLTRP